jgi:hypothetical protein
MVHFVAMSKTHVCSGSVTFGVFTAIFLFNFGSQAYADESTREYIIQKGDTCVGVSRAELGHRKGYREIHRLNPHLGKSPHRLVPGETLILPGTPSPDAELTTKSGSVRVKSVAKDWLNGVEGMDLFRRWRVNSLR